MAEHNMADQERLQNTIWQINKVIAKHNNVRSRKIAAQEMLGQERLQHNGMLGQERLQHKIMSDQERTEDVRTEKYPALPFVLRLVSYVGVLANPIVRNTSHNNLLPWVGDVCQTLPPSLPHPSTLGWGCVSYPASIPIKTCYRGWGRARSHP